MLCEFRCLRMSFVRACEMWALCALYIAMCGVVECCPPEWLGYGLYMGACCCYGWHW